MEAIENGNFSIGSFILPAIQAGWIDKFYYCNPKFTEFESKYLHIHTKERNNIFGKDIGFFATWSNDPLDFPENTIKTIPAFEVPLSDIQNQIDLQDQILLDIDLDFCCNKYDDVGTCHCSGSCNQNQFTLLFNKLLKLRQNNHSKTVLTTWALSPNFLNSDYWGIVLSGFAELFESEV